MRRRVRLLLDSADLTYYSHWIPPIEAPRRFSNGFLSPHPQRSSSHRPRWNNDQRVRPKMPIRAHDKNSNSAAYLDYLIGLASVQSVREALLAISKEAWATLRKSSDRWRDGCDLGRWRAYESGEKQTRDSATDLWWKILCGSLNLRKYNLSNTIESGAGASILEVMWTQKFWWLKFDEVAERNNKGQTNKAPETTSASCSK